MGENTKIPQFNQEIKKVGLNDHQGFPESLTKAEYMLQLSGKPSVLPSFGGEKGFVPSQALLEKTTKYYDELSCILGEERVCRIGSLSQGRWEPTRKLIVVEKAVGSLWQRFGTHVDGRLYALPEEGLFLIEQGAFELYLDHLPLSIEESWILLLMNLPSHEYYTVFAFLCRQGFPVVSSRKREYFLDGGFNVCRDSNVKHSIKEGTGTLHRASQQQLEESHFLDPHSQFPSSSFEKGDASTSKLCLGFDTFDNEGRENSKQTKSLEVCGIDLLGEGAEQSADKGKYGTPTASMEGLDKLAFKCSKDNMPLVLPQDAVTPNAVMKKLQIIRRRTVGCRSRRLRIAPVSEVASGEPACYNLGITFPEGSSDEKKEKEACKANEAVDRKNAPLRAYDVHSKLEETFETSTEVSLASTASKSKIEGPSFVPHTNPSILEQGTSVSSLLPDNRKIFANVTLPSFTPPKSNSSFGETDTDMSLQSRTQIFSEPYSVGCTSNVATLGDAQGQVAYPVSTSETTRKPCKQLSFFDVYHKATNFKKSAPGLADCRVFPCSYRELPNDLREIENIFDCSRNIPVKFGLCEQGSVTFYSMIPTDVSAVLKNEEIE